MHKPPEWIDPLLSFAAGLTPAALGATVTLLLERGLTWGQRFTQLAVGITVSFYVARVIAALWPAWYGDAIDPFVLDGVKFTAGLLAFKATPRFVAGAVEVIAGLPTQLRDRFLARKDDK